MQCIHSITTRSGDRLVSVALWAIAREWVSGGSFSTGHIDNLWRMESTRVSGWDL